MVKRMHGLLKWAGALCVAALLAGGATGAAQAEVRFGKNVRVGGHDFSGQRFNAKRRGRIYLYQREPARPGCRWVRNADGGRTKICHLKSRAR